MQFNISFDQALNSLPAGFVAAINYVTSYFDHLFTDPITINIDVGYGEVDGQTLSSGALGENIANLNSFSYAQVRSALATDSRSADDTSAVASLPSSDPIGGTHAYWLSVAEQRALGLYPATDSTVDGYVGFSNTYPFDYNRNDGISAGSYDFIGTVEHEISEVMGRVVLAGEHIIPHQPGYEPLDLFDYSSAGIRRLVGTNAGYFSIDGGVTNLDNFNTDPNGDFGDWAASAGNDAGLAFSSSGVLNNFSGIDVRAMDVLGYNRATATVRDFNDDGISDLLWVNSSTGLVTEWDMNSGQVLSSGSLGGDSNWSVIGTGDFNGDGMSDLLWRNSSGNVVLWEMNDRTTIGGGFIGGDLSWSIIGTGDFNGDGRTDILWRNNSNGNVVEWDMNGTTAISAGYVGGDLINSIAGTGDYNGDGMTDILWRNSNTGAVTEWDMNDRTTIATHALGGDLNMRPLAV